MEVVVPKYLRDFIDKVMEFKMLPPQPGNEGKILTTDGESPSWITGPSSLIVENAPTTSYTLVLLDRDKLVNMNVGSANNLTVPLNSTVAFPIGTQILIAQKGAGQTTVVATGGVTINSSGGKLKLTGQYSAATLIKIATDTWLLSGDLTS